MLSTQAGFDILYDLESDFAAARFQARARRVSAKMWSVRRCTTVRASLFRVELRQTARPDGFAQEPRSRASILGRRCGLPRCRPLVLAYRKSLPHKALLLCQRRLFSWAYRLPWWPIVRAHHK